jgi:hypothetical protein
MDSNTFWGIVCTIIAIALPSSFAVVAWGHTIKEKRRKKDEAGGNGPQHSQGN